MVKAFWHISREMMLQIYVISKEEFVEMENYLELIHSSDAILMKIIHTHNGEKPKLKNHPKMKILMEQFKILALVISPFVAGTYYIPYDCA